jgi:hypothetical protein
MVAFGVNPIHSDSYFRSGWNCLDFAIVVESVSAVANGGGSSFSSVRAVRALRPLRTITKIVGLRSIIDALLHAVALLGSSCIVMTFFFFMFGVVAVQLWAGTFHQHCYSISSGLVRPGHEYLCGGSQQCNVDEECLAVGPAPEYGEGVLHFDNLFNSIVVLFSAVSREGWTTAMAIAQDVSGIWAWLYFVTLMFIGSFVLVQLTLAVIMSSYVASVQQQDVERRREFSKREALMRVKKLALRRKNKTKFKNPGKAVSNAVIGKCIQTSFSHCFCRRSCEGCTMAWPTRECRRHEADI